VKRYLQHVNHAFLLQSQGHSHLDRGLNFIMLLESMVDGMPSTHTVDWIDGVGHEADKMYDNEVTVNRVC